MKAIKMERIVKKYYDALEEGRVLGRQCKKCGHIEYPPYLACNECGNLETEWIDLTNVRAHIVQILPPLQVFPETEWKNQNGGYIPIAVQIDGADAYDTSLVHVDADRYQELHDNLENVIVKPYIVQGDDTKVLAWVLDEYEENEADRAKEREIWEKNHAATEAVANEAASKSIAAPANTATAASTNAGTAQLDDISKTVIECAAVGYEVEASSITLATDIREDLSNQSMKMIVMIGEIEERLGVTIDIPDAGNLNTIADFVNTVRKGLGLEGTVSADDAAGTGTGQASNNACGSNDCEMDDIAKTVIECAATGYEVDAAGITLATDIREDLSNQSMKMIVMIGEIEEKLGVTIDIPDAGNLNTIADFVNKVKSMM